MKKLEIIIFCVFFSALIIIIFTLTSLNIVDPLITFIIIFIVGLTSLGSYYSFQYVKRVKKIRKEKKVMLLNKCIDILNLNSILIIEKKSGLNVYDQILTGKEIDTALIGEFLNIIISIGMELPDAEYKPHIIKFKYENLMILLSDYKNFRLILVMNSNPTEKFFESVKSLSYDLELEFGQFLERYNEADMKFLNDIKLLLEEHLNLSFVYPLKIDRVKTFKVSKAEDSIIKRAYSVISSNNLDHFYIPYLMAENLFRPKELKVIFRLLEKKVFYPIN